MQNTLKYIDSDCMYLPYNDQENMEFTPLQRYPIFLFAIYLEK